MNRDGAWFLKWGFLIVAVLVFLVLILILFPPQCEAPQPVPPPKPAGPDLSVIETTVSEVLVASQLSWFRVDDPGFGGLTWSVQIPKDLPVPSVHLAIQEGLERVGVTMLPSESEPVSGKLILRAGWPDSCLMRVFLWPVPDKKHVRGRIAILIDDFGDRWDSFAEAFLDLDAPLSVSIIPGLPYSERVFREAANRGKEILIHLPMQPKSGNYAKGPYLIHQSLTQNQVQSRMESVLRVMHGAVGVNNHMGSLVTTDRRLMRHVLEAVKKQNLFFVDSRTVAESVAYEVAQELGIPCANRDVFLDNTRSEDAIAGEIQRLARLAEDRGGAIGIGHGNRLTLEALRKHIPRLKADGFRFVRVSELVR